MINYDTIPSLVGIFKKYNIDTQQVGTDRFKCCCPFHQEKTPSLYIYTHEKKDKFYCFGCGEGGDALDALSLLTNQPLSVIFKNYNVLSNSGYKFKKKIRRQQRIKNHTDEFERWITSSINQLVFYVRMCDFKLQNFKNYDYSSLDDSFWSIVEERNIYERYMEILVEGTNDDKLNLYRIKANGF